MCFNPRSRTGSDTYALVAVVWLGCFNPRSRTGSDRCSSQFSHTTWEVSIHAPARGATKNSSAPQMERRCFNPRSRTGRDNRAIKKVRSNFRFQSTLPHGERRVKLDHFDIQYEVSIHAPARGATIIIIDRPPNNPGFNPRSRTGSDSGGSRCLLRACSRGRNREPPKFNVFICYVCVKSGGDAFVEAIANLLGKSCSLGVRRIKLSRYLQDHKILLRLRVQLFFSN